MRPMLRRGLCSNVSLIALAAEQRFDVTHFESIGSTNDAAMGHLRASGIGDHWFVADEQTGGRGRLGRQWSSPKGNLYASLAIRDPCPIALGYQLGFVAALAIYEAVLSLAVARNDLSLKWPNDVLLAGAKLSGILIEGGVLADGGFGAVIGCGINVTLHPTNTPYPATDLAQSGIIATTEQCFAALAQAFRSNLDYFDNGKGFGYIRKQWIERARGIGGPISVRQANDVIEGTFQGLDDQGKLLLAHDGKVTAIIAGDVFY